VSKPGSHCWLVMVRFLARDGEVPRTLFILPCVIIPYIHLVLVLRPNFRWQWLANQANPSSERMLAFPYYTQIYGDAFVLWSLFTFMGW
jgi:hypothetical protein